jgi:hypothetical protein
MENLIKVKWYIESPIDFEYKQYVLLSYLKIVDDSFLRKKLSPHFLHMENMIKELMFFKENLSSIKKIFDKNRYVYFSDNSKLEGENNLLINEIEEIVEFSIPQVQLRLSHGNFILSKNNQLLY